MEAPRLAGARFEPRELPGDSAADFVAAALRHAVATFEATIDLTGPEERFATMRHWYGADVAPLGEGRRRLRLQSESLDWLAAMVAVFSTRFDVGIVDAPDDAVAMLADAAQRLGAVTGPEHRKR